MRRLASLATIGLALVAITAPSSAATADSGRVIAGVQPIHDAGVFEPESTDCGFPIIADLSGEARYQVHLDEDGNFLWSHVLVKVTGTLSANGVTVLFDRADNQFFDSDGTVTEVGLVFRDSVPGVGVVLMDRGRLVWDGDELIFEAGPHPQLHGDYGQLCDVLSG